MRVENECHECWQRMKCEKHEQIASKNCFFCFSDSAHEFSSLFSIVSVISSFINVTEVVNWICIENRTVIRIKNVQLTWLFVLPKLSRSPILLAFWFKSWASSINCCACKIENCEIGLVDACINEEIHSLTVHSNRRKFFSSGWGVESN